MRSPTTSTPAAPRRSANWIVREGEPCGIPGAGWLARTGLDAWVVQRELADPISYVSLWLSDAGENPGDLMRRGADWLDWFRREQIAESAWGSSLFAAHRAGETREPDQVVEEITAAGEEVTGYEAKAFLDRRAYLRDTSDEHLLAARLSTAPVIFEQQSLPGDDGWQQQ